MRLTCLIDNCVDHGSPLWGEHGLSFLIETPEGNMLWDTGQSGQVLAHNLHTLGLEGVELSAIGLSHAHYDHTGGLLWALEHFANPVIYAHQRLFEPRYSKRKGELHSIGIDSWRGRLEREAHLKLSDQPQEIFPNVCTTGGIHQRPFPEGRSAHHLVLRGGQLVTDDYADDMSLVLCTDKGIVLLCGCCHAGLRNTLAAVRALYHQRLLAIVGGTHLVHVSDQELALVTDILVTEQTPQLFLNHCTGRRAINKLAETLGDRVHYCYPGMVIDTASLG